MSFDRNTTLRIWDNARQVLANPQASQKTKLFAKVTRDHAEVALGLDDAIKRMQMAGAQSSDGQPPSE